MKKKTALLALTVLVVGTLAGCGGKKDAAENGGENGKQEQAAEDGAADAAQAENKDSVYVKDFNAADYVTLGEYKGLEISATLRDVTDDYIQIYMDYIRTNNPVMTEVTDRPVQDGDELIIDYVGKIDDKMFEGGTASGQQLTIGSGSYIPGFEEGLIGAEIGKKTELNLTFPEDYNNTEVAGKAVTFFVTVQSITERTIPELNDEYVKGLGLEDAQDVPGYREYVKNLLTEDAQNTYEDDLENAAVEKAGENAQYKDVPEKLLDFYVSKFTDNLSQQAQMYGMSLEQYMQMMSISGDTQFESSDTEGMIRELALKGARQSLLFAAIADAEQLHVTDEELEAKIAENAETNGYESVEDYKAGIDTESYREYLMSEKVAKFLVENAKVTTLKDEDAQSGSAAEDGADTETDAGAEETIKDGTDTAETTEDGGAESDGAAE